MISIDLDSTKMTKQGKELVRILKHDVDTAFDGTVRKMDSNIKGLRGFFSIKMKEKLKGLSPKYFASGDIKRADLVKMADPIGSDAKEASAGLVKSRLYPFRLDMPEHNEIKYGYILGKDSAPFTVPQDTLAQWIYNKTKAGTANFMYYPKEGAAPVRADKPYIAAKVAYVMRKKIWGMPIKNLATDWYKISPTNPEIAARLKSLNNLYPAEFKKELENAKRR